MVSKPDQETIFRCAFEQAGVAMGLISLEGQWLHVNRALCQLVGYTGAELRMRTSEELTHPDDRRAEREHLADLVKGNAESYQIQKRYVHRNGQDVPTLLTASLLHNDDGSPRLFILQIQDLTGLKTPEDWQGLLEYPLALHFVAGFDKHFKKLSSNWADLLGHSIETLLSRPYMDFVHPDDRERTLREAARVEGGEEAVLFENRYRDSHGRYHWLLWTALPVDSEELIYGVAIDYTARMQIELGLTAALQDQRRLYRELDEATARIRELRQGLVRICAWTKKVYWDG